MRHRILNLTVAIGLLCSNVPLAFSQSQAPPAPRRQTSEPVSQDRKASNSETESPEVISVDTNLVNTLFTAVDNDRHFITSIRAEDIRILENEVVQPVTVFERETNRPLSLAILIDTSESQRGVLAAEKNSAQAFINTV